MITKSQPAVAPSFKLASLSRPVILSALLVLISLIFASLASVEAQSASAVKRPMIIAHRGGAEESTENTIGAFVRATRIGADGIETDIRLTRDGIVAVYHDDRYGRVEGLAPEKRTRLVSDMTYAELSAHALAPVGEDAGGRHVPTLADLLENVKTGLLNIELKRCDRFDELVQKTIAALKSFPELDRVVLEPPDLDTAEKLRAGLGTRLKLHINPGYDSTVPFSVSLERVLRFKPHSISVSYKKMSREIADLAHASGVEVWVWTVDASDIAEAMRILGADAIKTDKPTMLLKLFSKRNDER